MIVSMESELNCTSIATCTPPISALTSGRFVPSVRSNMTLRTWGKFWSAKNISILHRRCESLSFSAHRHASGISWAKYATRDLPDFRMTGSPHSGQENGACDLFAKYGVTISPVSFCLARNMGIFSHFNMNGLSTKTKHFKFKKNLKKLLTACEIKTMVGC